MKNKKIKCPVCKKDTFWYDNPFRPFCSERCRLIDRGKWASEDYRIPGEKKDIPDDNDDDSTRGFHGGVGYACEGIGHDAQSCMRKRKSPYPDE